MFFVGYADQNGHLYRAIGSTLVARGALKVEDVNLDSIRAWRRRQPGAGGGRAQQQPELCILHAPRATGSSARFPCRSRRSARSAVDPAFIPLGAPLWLDTTLH